MSGRKSKGVLLRGVEGMPVQVPVEILECQADLGPTATLVWINIVALSQLGRPLQINALADQMGLEKREVSQALAMLADRGWINDEGLEIQLTVPAHPESAATVEVVPNGETDAYEWLVSYISARVTVPNPDEKRKLLHWMQNKNLSHEVIAVAVEEMCASAAHQSFAYLEGILRNWHGIGVRTYNDLLENPYLAKVLGPIASSKEQNPAEQRWREVFPDEFD
ncbi:MAG TPA: DnaD domain protein [Firmicutes bacterium]|jgi:DnaD/phage-associated family protein|nr:DnaD domain protein [Bacillota bacterium]